MRHPKPLARSALGSAAEGTLLGSAPCKPGQPRDPTRRNLRAKTSPPLNHQLRGPTDDCPPLPPARPKQCRPTLHGYPLNAASHDLRTSDTSDKIEGAPLCRSPLKNIGPWIFNPRSDLAGVLKSSNRILFWLKQVLQGFYIKENWKNLYTLTAYGYFVGLVMNSTGRRETLKTVCDSCLITSSSELFDMSEYPWPNGWIPTSSPAALWP